MSQNVQSLFAGAQAGGDIGNAAVQVLNIPDLGMQMQAGLGVSVDDVLSSEVVLISLLIDDSSSIRFGGNEQVVRDGVNLILDSLVKSKQGGSILVSIRYLNGTVLTPFISLDQSPRLDKSNYQGVGSTPLYDQSVVMCGQVIAKRQEFTNGGVACRAVTVLVTDGADCGSRSADEGDVSKVVKDMLLSECHIVIGVGIDDRSTNFHLVFTSMGIEDEWILTPSNDPTSIRRAFQVVSQSAVRASQGAAGFSQAAGAGFTT